MAGPTAVGSKQRTLHVSKQASKSKTSLWGMLGIAVVCIGLGVLLPKPHDILDGFERVPGETELTGDLQHSLYTRQNVWIQSGDANRTMIAAWQYQPIAPHSSDGSKPPVVIMAHGLGGQRDFGLHKTADKFATSGMAVLVFDYRTFGASDGEPRNWADHTRHIEDWHAAVKYAQSHNGVWDASRLVLWGTSYSGGHVLVLASELQGKVSGVISQVPHLSGTSASAVSLTRRGLLPSIRLLLTGFYGLIRTKLGLPPVYVRLAGPLNSMSVMALDETELTAYHAKHPKVKAGGWQNKVVATFVTTAPRYSPINHIANITAPVMFVAAEKDTLCPTPVVKDAASLLKARLLTFDVDHFSLYLEPYWSQSTSQQLEFICHVTKTQCPATSQ